MIARNDPKMGNETSLEEKILSVFQSETLAEEYFETLHKRKHLEGEKALLLAVLEDAIACFQKYRSAQDHRGRELFREAEHWIMEAKDGSLFSFDSVCELLELDPRYLRQGLRRWKEKAGQKERTPHHSLSRQAA
jgi:hypothetical protein